MSFDFKHWKANDEERVIRKQTDVDWIETYYGRPIDKYKMIQNKNNEIYLYNTDSRTYFKLSAKDISYGTSLNSRFKYLYDGTWMTKHPLSTNHPPSSFLTTTPLQPKISSVKNQPSLHESVQTVFDSKKNAVKLFELISASEIISEKFEGPFGHKKLIYVDYTASGRSIDFIEDLIRDHVLPYYSNTHSDSNFTAEVISTYRKEARETVKRACNGKEELDSLIFVGSGSTAAVHKLIGILDIIEQPIVVVSPYEHHSNLLPWREIGSEIVYANDGINEAIDLNDLETKLHKYSNDKRIKIGAFSAASNVTGTLVDADTVSSLLHRYGFYAFWDYSTAAAHVKIDMNPKNDDLAYKDAVYFSGHKFIGGPQTPGVLIAKNNLFRNSVPTCAGGGTVHSVTKQKHIYISNNEEREEGGTPAIVESIRLGLVFQLKNTLNHSLLEQRENYYTKKAIDFMKKIPNLIILGNLEVKRLPIFSFLIKNEATGLYLHHNYVTKLLNDLFGIQSRSGCACAGPYAEYLLGISEDLAEKYLTSLSHKNESSARKDCWESSHIEILKPGFTRFNLPFFFDETRVDFVLEAIKFICEHGWKFLPQYNFNIETGKFTHVLKNKQSKFFENNLNVDAYMNSSSNNSSRNNNKRNSLVVEASSQQDLEDINLRNCLDEAVKMARSLEIFYGYIKGEFRDERPFFKEFKSIRWFLLPSEAFDIFQKSIIENNSSNVLKCHAPFIPITQFGNFDNTNKPKSAVQKCKQSVKGCKICDFLLIDEMKRVKFS